MSDLKSKTDIEIQKLARDKAETIVGLSAELEIERRRTRRSFLRSDLARWFALILSILSLVVSVAAFIRSGTSEED